LLGAKTTNMTRAITQPDQSKDQTDENLQNKGSKLY